MLTKIDQLPHNWRKVYCLFPFLTLLALLLATFTSLAYAQGNVLSDPPKNFELVQGWYQGRETFYYDFGANTPATPDGSGVIPAPIYVLVTGFDAAGNPQVVEGQHNLVDVIPGDEGYSDLWEVTFVTVPEDYQANSITSVQGLLDAGYEQRASGMYVNCPIVPTGSTLAEGGDLVQGWYKDQAVYYFDFGLAPATTAPIYVLVTGFDADGNPQMVEGQQNIVDVIPGDNGYSPFWDVHFVTVPADYQANSITAAADLLAQGYPVNRAGMIVNCPIIRTAELSEAMAAGEEQMMAEGETMAEGEMMEEDETQMMAGEEQMDEPAMAASETPPALPATGAELPNAWGWAVVAMGGIVLLGAGLLLQLKFRSKGDR